MTCTEAYNEHIEYTFNAFCRVVIRYAAINAWRDRDKRRQREISFEYLTEEKFYPFSTPDKFFTDPYKQYPVMICGQRVILTNGEFAEVLSVLPEKKGKSFTFTFSRDTHSRKSGNYTDAAGVRRGITYTVPCKCCMKKWRCFSVRNPKLVPYETIIRATSGEPEAVDEVLRHYSKRIRIAFLENGHVNKDTEDNIKRRLIAALFQIKVRGYADGVFEVKTAWNGEVLVRIKVEYTNVWEEYAAPVHIADGKQAIYLTYRGSGNASLSSFTLEQNNTVTIFKKCRY